MCAFIKWVKVNVRQVSTTIKKSEEEKEEENNNQNRATIDLKKEKKV